MMAYEFYLPDPAGRYQIVGILPERRKNPERVNQESVMRWGENIFGNDLAAKDIFFIQVNTDEDAVKIYRPVPITITEKK